VVYGAAVLGKDDDCRDREDRTRGARSLVELLDGDEIRRHVCWECWPAMTNNQNLCKVGSDYQRPIFIIGCPRSGTTLLRAMLNAHPNIAIPFEAERFSTMVAGPSPWKRVWTHREAAGVIEDVLTTSVQVKFWNLEKDAVLREVGPLESLSYADILRAIYTAYMKREGKIRWGDKTPFNAFEMPNLVRAFQDAQFIHIVRDGRDVYLSWSRLWRSGIGFEWAAQYAGDPRATARRWETWVWFGYRWGKPLGPGRYCEVRYEDLVRDPSSTLRGICEFLGEPFSKRMLTYYKANGLVPPEEEVGQHQHLSVAPDTSATFRWKREMRETDVKAFEAVAGRTLLKYGYEISGEMRRRAQMRLLIQRARQRLRDVIIPAVS